MKLHIIIDQEKPGKDIPEKESPVIRPSEPEILPEPEKNVPYHPAPETKPLEPATTPGKEPVEPESEPE